MTDIVTIFAQKDLRKRFLTFSLDFFSFLFYVFLVWSHIVQNSLLFSFTHNIESNALLADYSGCNEYNHEKWKLNANILSWLSWLLYFPLTK